MQEDHARTQSHRSVIEWHHHVQNFLKHRGILCLMYSTPNGPEFYSKKDTSDWEQEARSLFQAFSAHRSPPEQDWAISINPENVSVKILRQGDVVFLVIHDTCAPVVKSIKRMMRQAMARLEKKAQKALEKSEPL